MAIQATITSKETSIEFGFFSVNFNAEGEMYSLQACLEKRKDRKGYKKEVQGNKTFSGFNWGQCSEVNELACSKFGEDECFQLLLKEARKENIKVS